MAIIRNRPTMDGRKLGLALARFCDEAEPGARLKVPELPPRCASCALRDGPHAANGSPSTLMDALKCVLEGEEFLCHEPARDGSACSGWAMLMLAYDRDLAEAPWPFSDAAAVR